MLLWPLTCMISVGTLLESEVSELSCFLWSGLLVFYWDQGHRQQISGEEDYPLSFAPPPPICLDEPFYCRIFSFYLGFGRHIKRINLIAVVSWSLWRTEILTGQRVCAANLLGTPPRTSAMLAPLRVLVCL